MTASCPDCSTRLDGGPVLYRCPTCQRAVYAADLDVEVTATTRRRSA
ncbi:hypothetical protein ACFV0L_43575 [Streptosporangium canum]